MLTGFLVSQLRFWSRRAPTRHPSVHATPSYRCLLTGIPTVPPQPLMPMINGSMKRVVISSQDARWTWSSHYSFDAAQWCAVKHGSAYASEAEVLLLSNAEVRAILQRGLSKKCGAPRVEAGATNSVLVLVC